MRMPAGIAIPRLARSLLVLSSLVAASLAVALVYPTSGFAQEAPKFFLSNLEGKRFDSRKYKGPYVVSFFFVGCPPCIKEMPALQDLMEQDLPGVPLLFIDPVKDDNRDSIKRFIRRINVSLVYVYHDAFGRVGKKFNAGKWFREFPTIIAVKDKSVVFRLVGSQKFNDQLKRKFIGLTKP